MSKSGIRPRRDGCISGAHVQQLSPEALSGLTMEQVENLNPDSLTEIDASKITYLQPNFFSICGPITPECVEGLNPDVFSGLTSQQIENFTDGGLLHAIDAEQIIGIGLPENVGVTIT